MNFNPHNHRPPSCLSSANSCRSLAIRAASPLCRLIPSSSNHNSFSAWLKPGSVKPAGKDVNNVGGKPPRCAVGETPPHLHSYPVAPGKHPEKVSTGNWPKPPFYESRTVAAGRGLNPATSRAHPETVPADRGSNCSFEVTFLPLTPIWCQLQTIPRLLRINVRLQRLV